MDRSDELFASETTTARRSGRSKELRRQLRLPDHPPRSVHLDTPRSLVLEVRGRDCLSLPLDTVTLFKWMP